MRIKYVLEAYLELIQTSKMEWILQKLAYFWKKKIHRRCPTGYAKTRMIMRQSYLRNFRSRVNTYHKKHTQEIIFYQKLYLKLYQYLPVFSEVLVVLIIARVLSYHLESRISE